MTSLGQTFVSKGIQASADNLAIPEFWFAIICQGPDRSWLLLRDYCFFPTHAAMASLLRQIVAGPRAKHQETGLDLCYVTSQIIATSGPSQTYPQRAYRNPLDRLVTFLDEKHGDGWAIWEFRAEGTGYPDEAVYNRIRHYPWPDHHPPPFRLVPMIMAGMRNWLAGGELEGGKVTAGEGHEMKKLSAEEQKKINRVVVVHCKAGKGRSGSMACSYLISECGWTPEDALARFTERRMRPNFGAGVSIPSQLRWISYVDRWTKGGKKYVDREIEILEIHVWGLRHGVKVSVEGFVEEGKKIRVIHTFKRDERIVVEGDAPGGAGIMDLVSDMTGYGAESSESDEAEDPDFNEIKDGTSSKNDDINSEDTPVAVAPPARSASKKLKASKTTHLMKKLSVRKKTGSSQSLSKMGASGKSKTIAMPDPSSQTAASASSLIPPPDPESKSTTSLQNSFSFADSSEPGGQAVIFKPKTPVCLFNSDVNIAVERRNRAPASMGLTMVTAVAHVWFNTFFEGNGPEQDGRADDSGVFEIEWDKMDGIKGSSRKGTRACDRLSVVWRVVGTTGVDEEAEGHVVSGVTINEPGEDSPVPQMQAADWKGGNEEDPTADKHLGLRVQDPDSASVSKASSIKSLEIGGNGKEVGEKTRGDRDKNGDQADDESLAGVKISGPAGEEVLDELAPSTSTKKGDKKLSSDQLPGGEKADATAKNGFIIE
ncbi:phosphoinositide 3-phosphate phosphatase [Podospora didyma]|uniref:phosphatidylinositol-3,4,5-trisphosphate 3-phosphatase n=1 Tax=Podospora didyma TaxID=330526 RepID=A0AAE0P107_9PEZI|nr:phosphoinositide 3-phosphate phosphatase [Podospora didyma]